MASWRAECSAQSLALLVSVTLNGVFLVYFLTRDADRDVGDVSSPVGLQVLQPSDPLESPRGVGLLETLGPLSGLTPADLLASLSRCDSVEFFRLSRQLASQGSGESGASGASGGQHPHDALLFLFNAIIIGTVVLHLTTMPKLHGMQQTVTLFVLGIVYSLVQEGLGMHKKLGVLGDSYYMWMEIDPHLLLFAFLPALLMGDAMTIDTTVARRVASQCLYLAGPGVLMGAFLTAAFLKVYLPYEWSFLLCLTLGAILAATDPVAVVSLLKQLGASPILTIQIAGESLLNDGMAIVLYILSYDMLQGSKYDSTDVMIFLIKTVAGACGLGWVIGWIFALWIRNACNRLDHHSGMIQVSLTICCAYWSFIIAEGVLGMSGVLCNVSASLVLADKMWSSIVEKEAMSHVWHMLEYLGNTLIFFLAGALMGNCMVHIPLEDYLHLVVLYLVSIAIRFFLLFASRPILRRLGPEVTRADAVVMAWGGLRGAVGLALAIQVSISKADGQIEDLDARRVLFYTGGIATLTLLINATTCPALVRTLGITVCDDSKQSMLRDMARQLHYEALETERVPLAVRHVIEGMLEEVMVAVGAEMPNQGAMLSMEKVLTPLVPTKEPPRKSNRETLRRSVTANMIKVIDVFALKENTSVVASHQLLEQLDCARTWVADVSDKQLKALKEVPTISTMILEQEPYMRSLLQSGESDPQLIRTTRFALLALVNHQYWQMIETGSFIENSNDPDLLLESVSSALESGQQGLADFRFIIAELGMPTCDGMHLPPHDKRRTSMPTRTSVEMANLEVQEGDTCIQRAIKSKLFNIMMTLAVVLNVLNIFIEDAVRKDDREDALWTSIEIGFVLIFSVELCMKAAAMRCNYFSEVWNIFDLLLVVTGAIGIIVALVLQDSSTESFDSKARVFRINRIFRVARLMRIFRLAKMIRVLLVKLKGQEISLELAAQLHTITVLMSFVQAHIHAQHELLRFFGNNGKIKNGAQARVIIESMISVSKAVGLAALEVGDNDLHVLRRMHVLRHSKRITHRLTSFVTAAQEVGVVNSREAETMLHPLRDHSRVWEMQLKRSMMGVVPSAIDLTDTGEDQEEDIDEEGYHSAVAFRRSIQARKLGSMDPKHEALIEEEEGPEADDTASQRSHHSSQGEWARPVAKANPEPPPDDPPGTVFCWGDAQYGTPEPRSEETDNVTADHPFAFQSM